MKTYTKKDFQNPENLTRQQVGEEHRLLLPEEVDGRMASKASVMFSSGSWCVGDKIRNIKWTYRVPLATPLPDGTVLTSNECCWADDVVQPEPQKPKVYCAGPMRGHADWNFPAFFAASEFLEQQGYAAINPAQLDCDAGYPLERLKLLTPEEFQEFLKGAMKRDLDAIQSCDALVLLPGWEKSKGARAEKAVAEWAGLRVGYLWMAACCPTGERMKLTWEDAVDWNPPEAATKEYPQPDPDGWIPHVPGDPQPLNDDMKVDVAFRCGKETYNAEAFRWSWNEAKENSIIAWRPHQSQPKQPYSSDERAEWDVEQPKFHPNDPKGAAGAKKAPMHLLPPLPLMQLAWAMGHGAAKYGVNNFLDAKVLASTYIAAIGRHWAQFSSGEDNDNDSGLSHIALLAANCMILMAAADAGTLIDDRRKQP